MNFISVYVGKYENTSISKKDLKKLNELGLKGYLYSLGDYYSIKVASFPDNERALKLKEVLEKKGFISFIN